LTVFDTIVRTAALAQTVVRDTVVALPAHEGWRVWVDTLSGIAQIVIALALLAIGVVMMAIAFLLWKVYRQAKAALAKLRIDVDPAVQNAIHISETAKGMASTVQGNVQEVSRTVSSANEKVGRVVESVGDRAADLNALLDVAQQEAEELFIRTAATLRGVRAGAGVLRRAPAPRESEGETEIRIEARDPGAPGAR
jgi:uncharacterized protein YoxC